MESVEALDVFSESSARYRYRVPVAVLRELPYEGSRYSQEFDVGGWSWRFHIQERDVGGERFLALHLQSCSRGAVPVHFKLTVVCFREPLLSKSKAFHCTFKKAGSAWGLHQFIPISQLLDPSAGYVYTVEETMTRCVDFEVTLQVEPGGDNSGSGALVLRSPGGGGRFGSPQERGGSPSRSLMVGGSRAPPPYRGGGGGGGEGGLTPRGTYGAGGRMSGALVPVERSVDRRSVSVSDAPGGGYPTPGRRPVGSSVALPVSSALTIRDRSVGPRMARVQGGAAGGGGGGGAGASSSPAGGQGRTTAALTYPFEHLEALCDMTFDVQGIRVKAHRCVIGARMQPLLPEQMLPLQVGCIVAIAVPLDVFTTFLKYVYTEEFPEHGVLPPESLLDLYLLAAACEFYDLGSVCLDFVRPLLTPENILPIVLTRYNAADDVLNSLYLNVILENYPVLIDDKQFEEIPGHLNRKLLLILYQKDKVASAPIPPMKNTLGKQLAWLAETGEYSDFEWIVGPQKYAVRAHRYILACRSVAFSQAVNQRSPGPVPNCTGQEFGFSLRSWQKLLTGMYRRHLDVNRDFSAEDIAIVFKMQNVLGMDGHLKREADEAFSVSNALRVLIYAVKHQIPELHERALAFVASNFHAMIRDDPQAWELISELPQSAVISLFRTVTENQG